jgi:4a-hydroxytetrahydrobiopterin dehydratase
MADTYSTEEINTRLTGHPAWSLNEEGELTADFTLGNFKEAMMFVNGVALLAENANHHPDILMHGWKNVRISLMSHDAGGITDRDFDLITAIDALPTFSE